MTCLRQAQLNVLAILGFATNQLIYPVCEGYYQHTLNVLWNALDPQQRLE